MTFYEVLTLPVRLLGGGRLTTIISIYFQRRAARRASELKYLDEALRHVYGPVLHLLTASKMLLTQNRNVDQTCSEHFKRDWAEPAMESVNCELKATLEAANDYAAKAVEKIDHVVNIVSTAWHVVDPKDKELFNDIFLQRERIRVEYDDLRGNKKIPPDISMKLGVPCFYKDDWLIQIEASYKRKLARYEALAGKDKGQSKGQGESEACG